MRSTTKRPDLRRPALAGGAFALALLAIPFIISGDPRETPSVPVPPPPVSDVAESAADALPLPMAPSPEGLRLYGLLGTGAIIGLPSGVQRWVPIGRDVIPGLRLQEVRQHQAVLVSSAGTVELTLDGRVTQAAAAPASPAATEASAVRSDEILHYRFGLAPERAGGRITGFAIRPEADLPVLRRAGLQPGDVLVGVNGQSFDSQERVQELASEIAGSFTAEFEFLRGGRRMRTSLEVNRRD